MVGTKAAGASRPGGPGTAGKGTALRGAGQMCIRDSLKGDKYAADGDTVNVYVSHPTWTGSSESDKRTFNYTGAASGNSGAKLPSNGEASFQVVIADADQALAVTVS